MRLLVITNDFPPNPGGIENYIYSLVRRWPPHEVIVVTRRMAGSERFDAMQDFEIVREPVDTLFPKPGLVRRLNRMVHEREIDLVHFPSVLPLGLMGEGLGRPYALTIHGGEFVLASRIPGARTALKAVCRGAGMIMPESSFAESLVTALLGPQVPMARVTCGVDVDRYARGAADPVTLGTDGPVVVSVGRQIPRKGGRTLISAFPEVLKSHPDAHLMIVGGGPDLARLEDMVAEGRLEASVTLAGPQPWDRIPGYLAAADIFALPTRTRFLGTETEGLPLVYVEAAAAGLPLIGADVGGVCDAVRPGETGLLVDGSDPGQTASAIVGLMDDPGEARRLGSGARKMVEQEFSWDAIYGLYRKAMESAR